MFPATNAAKRSPSGSLEAEETDAAITCAAPSMVVAARRVLELQVAMASLDPLPPLVVLQTTK